MSATIDCSQSAENSPNDYDDMLTGIMAWAGQQQCCRLPAGVFCCLQVRYLQRQDSLCYVVPESWRI